ncbi:hypothetical protein I4F81_003115 [Pyropia yezoensis]|uniref:Uncharacterized protein n=1 Tax=Pyropia yezoensis TaxID=2788 RepID=A0ACC3BSV2_PYRYE|nr:hypothetical protein I4F81_003115 [Neopyropia yezoensis]
MRSQVKIASPRRAYLFDTVTCAGVLAPVRALREDPSLTKLLHDCRRDADASLSTLLCKYAPASVADVALKAAVKARFVADPALSAAQPPDVEALEYAVVDVQHLFGVYDRVMRSLHADGRSRVATASELYCSAYRGGPEGDGPAPAKREGGHGVGLRAGATAASPRGVVRPVGGAAGGNTHPRASAAPAAPSAAPAATVAAPVSAAAAGAATASSAAPPLAAPRQPPLVPPPPPCFVLDRTAVLTAFDAVPVGGRTRGRRGEEGGVGAWRRRAVVAAIRRGPFVCPPLCVAVPSYVFFFSSIVI